MRLVKIATAAVSVKVGDFAGNTARLEAVVGAARAEGAHLLVTPELCISGYSLEDRVFWPDIVRHSWLSLERLAPSTSGLTAFFGLPVRVGAMIYNAAALVHDGQVRGLVLKKYLPTYSIFYEGRNWTAWGGGVTSINDIPAGDLVFEAPWGKFSAEICEDLWSTTSPAQERVLAGSEIICNLSASPFTPRKNEERKRLVQGAAANLKAVYAYANLLGCDNSRVVFDGGGLIATPEALVCAGPLLSMKPWTLVSGIVDLDDIARMRAENTTWRQGMVGRKAAMATELVVLDGPAFEPARLREYVAQMPPSFYMPTPAARDIECDPAMDELFAALVLGLRDYYEKVGAFRRILVALSGGRDSALCLLMAVEAMRGVKEGTDAAQYADRVQAVYLPNSNISSSGTENAARNLAEQLGVPFHIVVIDKEIEAARSQAAAMLQADDAAIAPLAKQNLQARIRGAAMLNWANSAEGLVLVTSNLSEAAVGYSTTGGDNQGGYSPIANVPKTLVSGLLEYLAKRDNITALEQVLTIPPSAELAPDQQDETDLMPYPVLDDLLYLYARRRMALADCWRVLCHRHVHFEPETLRTWTAEFGRRFTYNQWKRDQHPVALKVMDLDLDPKTGFRFPVTQSIQYELDDLKSAVREKLDE